MFWSWSEDVHIVLGIILRVVLLLFSQVAFSRFLCVYYYQNDQILGTLCAPLLLPFYALYRCFCPGLIFLYDPQRHSMLPMPTNRSYLVYATAPTDLYCAF